MKKYSILFLTSIMALILLVTSCQREVPLKTLTPNVNAQSYNYKTTAYQNVIQMGGDNSSSGSGATSNTLSNGGATLGRLLFYDPRLSINNAVACATCHKQQFAFADNVAFSEGYQGQKTIRNTPAIINAANKASFFWDGRETSLETQTLMPVKNHIEMGLEQTDVLVKKLSKIDYYGQYFRAAFGSSEITSERISMALAQFVRSIASAENQVDLASLNADALAGQTLFFGRLQCGTCHRGTNFGGAPMFNTYFGGGGGGIDDPFLPVNPGSEQVPNTSNIGLDVNYKDQGEQALTGKSAQNGYFIIPSLRNVSLTAPYMHDGRFKTLDEVIDHYSNGIQSHPNLDPLLFQQNFNQRFVSTTSGQPARMNITAEERKQLKAFLNSLTDQSIISDPKFANPFK